MIQVMEYGDEIWDMTVRSLYKVGSLMTVSRELSNYKLDLVGVQELGWGWAPN
jgi:hypothetical protein